MAAPGYRSAELSPSISDTGKDSCLTGKQQKKHPKLFKTYCARWFQFTTRDRIILPKF